MLSRLALDIDSVRTRKGAALLGGLALAHAATVGGALSGATWVCLAGATVGVVLDLLAQNVLAVRTLLGRLQFNLLGRTIVRELSLVILLMRIDAFAIWAQVVAALAIISLPAGRLVVLSLRAPVVRRSLRPVETLNIALDLKQPRLTPAWAMTDVRALAVISAVPILLCAFGVRFGNWVPFLVGIALALALMAAMALVLARTLLSMRGVDDDAAYLRAVGDRVRARRPEVVLYFSGSAASVYQVNMWLGVVDAMPYPCLIVLRERANLRLLEPTRTPVVCIPMANNLMDFRLPTVRVAFYVANVGKNLHFLREPRVKHVFIGHGESDKIASINPFTKVHDEVWVAGPASRARWAAAKVGVRDETVVEVGRPQLGAVRGPRARTTAEVLSVLYAPTWEGWTADPYASSLITMGPALVRWLLGRSLPTRVIYKPHPLTGTVSPAAADAHAAVLALLEGQGAQHAGASTLAVDLPAAADLTTSLAGESPVEAVSEDPAASPDAVEGSEGMGGTQVWGDQGGTRVLTARHDEASQDDGGFWAAHPGHLVVEGSRPTLYDCFNHADVLLSDISSVVSDFLASGKPYIVANPASRPHEQMRADFATTRGAYLADADPDGWEPLLRELEFEDALREARRDLRGYLLGPYDAQPLARWNAATADLLRRARQEWPDAERESAVLGRD